MLKSFSITNYKCFKNTETIDFHTRHNYNFNNELIRNGLVNKAMVVGPNGSGKTNLGFALFDIVRVLTDFAYNERQSDVPSFLNYESSEEYATFVYEFVFRDSILRYEYRKTDPNRIIYESLYVDDDIIFAISPDYSDFENLKKYAKDLIIQDRNLDISFLRYIARNSIQQDDSPIRFIMDFVSRMLYFKSDNTGNTYIGLSNQREWIVQRIIKDGTVKEFQEFLSRYGKMDVKLEVIQEPDGSSDIYQLSGDKKIRFDKNASSGTKMLLLLFYWSKSFDKVSFLYMDEFDAFYHYDLSERIMRMITDLDTVQSVVTSHNVSLMSNSLLRPDCYWMIDMGHHVRAIPERTQRELRQGHSLERLYRNEEFDE